jgi:hypothetical protein
MWRVSYFARVRIGIAILLFVVLNSAVRESISTLFRSRNLGQTHYISQYEERFADLHRFLPANQTAFYIDDFDESSDQCDAFYLAQYSLAPAVLVAVDSKCGCSGRSSTQTPSLVVENLHDPENDPYLLHLFPTEYFDAHPRKDQFQLASVRSVSVRDFGHGLRLYAEFGK